MVKPVDLQDNLSKTQLLEKVHQLKRSSPDIAQKQFDHELQKKIEEEKERPAGTPKSDKIIIRKDEKRKRQEQDKEETTDNSEPDEQGNQPEDNEKSKKKRIDYIA